MKKKEAIRYAQMLLARAEHTERCATHLANGMLESLNLDRKELSDDEREIFDTAANLAYTVISKQGGIDFMFSEEGEFAGVVI